MPDDNELWPQERPSGPSGPMPSPVRGGPTNPTPFPEPAFDDASGSSRTATLTRRTVAAGGLAGVAFLAACNTVPELAKMRWRQPATAAPTPSPSPTAPATPAPSASPSAPLPTMSGSMNPSAPATATASASASAEPSASPSAPPVADGPASAEMVARRLTFGPTAALMADIEASGTGAWLEAQLDPASVGDPMGDAVRGAFDQLNRPYTDFRGDDVNDYELTRDVQARALALATWSSRQLFEVMVNFWSNHVGVAPRADDTHNRTRADYDNSVIRANALGTFRELLRASGMHPCMMEYLSLNGSHKDNPNENYAREILELYTLGVDGGYTEDDIIELSKGFTGWVVPYRKDGDSINPEGMIPQYVPDRHYVGPFTLLGRTFENPTADSGPAVFEEVTEMLVTSETTARYLSWKLVRHFVADDPTPYEDLIGRMAQAYLSNDTAIVPMLRELFNSPEFAGSDGLKARRPLERYVAMLRLTGPELPGNVAEGSRQLFYYTPGMEILGHYPPDGYPDVMVEWASAGTALGLFNVARYLLRKDPGDAGLAGADPIVAAGPQDHTEVAIEAARALLLRDPTDAELDAVLTVLGSGDVPDTLDNDDVRRWAAEIAGTVLLSSPSHLLR
ncbi:MAG: DUF1800 domain-containing protein [Kineosporiaceae bacterium]